MSSSELAPTSLLLLFSRFEFAVLHRRTVVRNGTDLTNFHGLEISCRGHDFDEGRSPNRQLTKLRDFADVPRIPIRVMHRAIFVRCPKFSPRDEIDPPTPGYPSISRYNLATVRTRKEVYRQQLLPSIRIIVW